MAILLLIWPFGALIYSLYNYERRESAIVFVLYTALFGYSLVAESSGLDLFRVMQLLPEAYRQTFSQFIHSRSDKESIDIYRDTMVFLISRFTSNSQWLMAALGLVAGFVYVKVLSLFLEQFYAKNIYTYLLILTFSLIIGIDQLAGVRFSLAAYVFFFGTIKVILYGDRKYLFIAALSVLIHFSFLSAVLVLFLFLWLKRFPKLIYVLLIMSFVLPTLLHNYIIQYSGLFGSGISARTEMYSSLNDNSGLDDTVWFVKLRIPVMMTFCYLALLVTRIRKNSLNCSLRLSELFLFTLTMLAFVNFTMDIPHFGFRFQFIFIIFVIFYLFKIYSENAESTLIKGLVLISVPFSLLMVLYTLRSTLSITPLSLYYFNLPGLFFDKPVHSVWTTLF